MRQAAYHLVAMSVPASWKVCCFSPRILWESPTVSARNLTGLSTLRFASLKRSSRARRELLAIDGLASDDMLRGDLALTLPPGHPPCFFVSLQVLSSNQRIRYENPLRPRWVSFHHYTGKMSVLTVGHAVSQSYPSQEEDIFPTAYMFPTSLRRPIIWTRTTPPLSMVSLPPFEKLGGVESGLYFMSLGSCCDQ